MLNDIIYKTNYKKFVTTNAASSGIVLEKKKLKNIAKRSDIPGIIFLIKLFISLILTGFLVWISLGTFWVWAAVFLYGTVLTLASYSLSHETAHTTAFKTRWLNEAVFWISSLIYMEEPLHRRFTHTNHHTYTWHVGKDTQMPFDTPMTFWGWFIEISGISTYRYQFFVLFRLVLQKYSVIMKDVIPENQLAKSTINARIFLLIYLSSFVLILNGIMWPLWFFILPRILGTPVYALFALIQHVELQENSPSIIESTRSFETGWLARFLYMNMNYHIEHHLYPQIPFYALPNLNKEIRDQLPKEDKGFLKTNLEVLIIVIKRSLGKNTKAYSIRQSPNMVTEGYYENISKKSF